MVITAESQKPRACPEGLIILFLVVTILFQTGCSVPVLESTQCTEARNDLREFYSFHFGNDMRPTPDNLLVRRRFLSDQLYEEMAATQMSNGATDYFTKSDEYPRTFRVGKCEHFPDASSLTMQVQLYWRDDQKTTQKEVKVDMEARDNFDGIPGWHITKVY